MARPVLERFFRQPFRTRGPRTATQVYKLCAASSGLPFTIREPSLSSGNPRNEAPLTTSSHLRKAPILEALIDVRVEARPAARGEDFRPAVQLVKDRYPNVEERRGVTLEVAFGAAEPTQKVQDHGLDGFFVRAADNLEIAQFRIDGFTFNRLAPYTAWEDILPRALRLLEIYLDHAKPLAVSRIATRYINRLRFPAEQLGDYLTALPGAIPGIDAAATAFSSTIVGQEASGAQVRYSQALESVDPAGVGSVILDIDVMVVDRLAPQLGLIAPRLELLHEVKNRVFFGSITDSARHVFS